MSVNSCYSVVVVLVVCACVWRDCFPSFDSVSVRLFIAFVFMGIVNLLWLEFFL